MDQTPSTDDEDDEAESQDFFRHDVHYDIFQLETAINFLHEHPRYLLEPASSEIKKSISRLTKLLSMLQPVNGGQEPPRAGLMRPVEAADYLRTSTATLGRLRKQGNGPEYSKFGVRILYSKNALDKFLASQ